MNIHIFHNEGRTFEQAKQVGKFEARPFEFFLYKNVIILLYRPLSKPRTRLSSQCQN